VTIVEKVLESKSEKITETKQAVKKTKKTSSTETLEHITSLLKVINKPRGKDFKNSFVEQIGYASISDRVDVLTQLTQFEGQTIEKVLIKQGFNKYKSTPDRIALSDDECISLVGVLVKKYPQIKTALKAL
jgi:hypothetical protein